LYNKKLPKNCRYLFTNRIYKKDENSFIWSKRLFMSKECATIEERRMFPVLIINLDGAFGCWDDSSYKYYILRPKILESII
jgi:hypothetical protein